MDIKVKVDVEIGAGAKVSLTDAQVKEVQKMVTRLITGEVPMAPVAKTKKRRRPNIVWTQEADNAVLRLSQFPRGIIRSKEITKIAKAMNCARKSVIARKHELLKTKNVTHNPWLTDGSNGSSGYVLV